MGNKKIQLFDIAMLLMIVTSIAFYDIKILFLLMQFLAIAFAVPAAIKNKVTKKSIVVKYIIWALLFILYSLLSVLWASEENETVILTVLSTLQVFLLSITIIIYCGSKWDATNKILNYIIYSAVILITRFFVTVPRAYWGDGERFSKDTVFGSNAPAIALAYASLVLFWRIISNKKVNRKMSLLFICLIIAFMFVALLMGTKKSILIFSIGSIAMLIINSKNTIKTLRNLAIAAIFMLIGCSVIRNTPTLYNSIGYRIDAFIQDISSDSASGLSSTAMRKKFVEEAMQIYPARPIQGIGQDGFRYKNSYTETYSHCNYVEILVNLGLIGFFIYYSVYILIMRNIKKNIYNGLVIALVITMLFVDVAAVSYSMEIFYILFGIIIGILSETEQKKKGEIENETR